MEHDLALWEQELSDVPTWADARAEELSRADDRRIARLTGANDAWAAIPYVPEKSLLFVLRVGRRLRRVLRMR